MSGGDILSWRIPSAVREAGVKKPEAEGKVGEARKSKYVTLEDREGSEGKNLLYLILLLVVVGVILMAVVLLSISYWQSGFLDQGKQTPICE